MSCSNCCRTRCCCVSTDCSPNIIHTYRGCYEAYLTRTMTPSSYSASGQIIVISYTIENKGSLPFCKIVKICDSLVGENCYQCVDIQPCCSQTFSTSYVTTTADMSLTSIPTTTVAYIQVKKSNWIKTNCVQETLNKVI